MKKTLNTYQVADEIRNDKNSDFSANGSFVLAEHLEVLEMESGKEKELNLGEIRGFYTEYPTALDAVDDIGVLGFDLDENANEEEALSFLRIRTIVLQFDTGIIVGTF